MEEVEKEKEREMDNDKIRKINADQPKSGEDSEENPISQEIKKRAKALKLEERFGYAFYGHVRCLMVAYGDLNPTEQSIKMMHSQLETMKFQIFKNVPGDYSKPAKMKHYLSQIFP